MFLLIEGIKKEERFISEPNPYQSTGTAGGSAYYNSLPMPHLLDIKYRYVVDSKEILLVTKLENNKEEYVAEIKGKYLHLTKEVYDDITKKLAKINTDEAILLNELALEKGIKSGVKELEDINLWAKKEVNGLLGLELE